MQYNSSARRSVVARHTIVAIDSIEPRWFIKLVTSTSNNNNNNVQRLYIILVAFMFIVVCNYNYIVIIVIVIVIATTTAIIRSTIDHRPTLYQPTDNISTCIVCAARRFTTDLHSPTARQDNHSSRLRHR
jgi:hypothetical protein